MLFSEVYGSYYNAVAAVISEALQGDMSDTRIREIVLEKAFGESITSIPDHLKDQSWPLLRNDLTTPIRHIPRMPLTSIQKQWMKALLSDPRIALFQPDTTGLEDVMPLFSPEAIVYYDRYSNGDPFTDPQYIAHFRTILRAFREQRYLHVRFRSHSGDARTYSCVPLKLEYSPKDDKFRLITDTGRRFLTINLARVLSCKLGDPSSEGTRRSVSYRERSVELVVTDERNALDRVMLHFSDLEKETVRLDEKHYRVTLYYKRDDETEILIRILSFGSVIRVTAPTDFIQLIRERIAKQALLRHNPA